MPVVVITGTSSGIGLAGAIAFARAGHRTYATMRNLDKAEPLRAAARDAGVDVAVEALDVTDAASVTRGLDAIAQREGRIDVLVNNAGIGGATPLENVPEAEHRQVFETNYWGCVRTIQHVLPDMRERGSGAIVNVSSCSGLVATPNQAPYSASKFALEGLSESLAYEVRPLGVRVVLVEPGIVETEIIANGAPMTRYDRASPYRDLMRHTAWLYAAGLKNNPTQPDAVADVILEAVTTDTPKLRYVVGHDCHQVVRGRGRITDEEFLSLSELDDDAYRARFKQVYGIEL